MKLKDKVCLVTGAASGIGKEIALTFAREGAKVAIADLNRQAANAAAAEFAAQRPDRAWRSPSTSPTRRRSTRRSPRLVAAWGGVDVLVSNAGIQIVHPLEEFPFAEWKKMLAIHLDGAFLTTKACLPHMYALGPRRQHHLHGLGALEGGVGAEGAVRHREARPDRAREDDRQGRRASTACAPTSICPGFVRTPLVDKQIPEQAQALGHQRRRRHQEGDAEGHRRRRVHDHRRTSPKSRCCSRASRRTR